MKTLVKYLILMALAAKLCMPGVALAYLTGGTWIETSAENGYAPFTKIEVFAG
jgi:NADH:ubiquinone oxidoreductase subunit 2 (subunit N)